MKPVIIVPAFNPDDKLITLVEDLKRLDLEIIVVNDGSKQECSSIFETIEEEFQCMICTHSKNMGKGAALKTGISYVLSHFPNLPGFVTADADGQHSPKDIYKVAEFLENNSSGLILGKRDFSGKNIPLKSYLGNRITSFVFLLSTAKKCPDTQTGLRGIPMAYSQNCLSVEGDRYEFEMNMLFKMAREGVPFIYVPIDTIYLADNASSHFHPVKDSVRIYLNIFKYSFSSLLSAMLDLSLFTILAHLVFGRGTIGLLAATVIARLTSGSFNYLVNKHWVFKSKNKYGGETLTYFTLFCSQMFLSWLFVSLLKNVPLNLTFIKILVDSILFILSYNIQKKYIFVSKRKKWKTDDKKIYRTL
ncbi:bifunctional glycosyltransferase family 2/GtrA family protein [Clostridium aminobutyricum]|uniref:Bifunctional glycosyltransferase family 2/GtrA family protein n=1 Tax=Clostridium aminobutyricum TaxID=33953 RepID=A0A939IG39_CLOAM|nr:bifunctional glycosyltransferase family 2/GtrA family protein [Clostridium aminobutyricum]MBN7772510.1 bifunctional glycosyltransferase family 2/GtrA family protein [Clostridium aminobutyricum]